ncbi:MAG: hypothetical protein NC826_06015 [Candidatus Omnitrophica bacterium]|nr:hypothetical protein [Candidatus Omnitrophota bacterium]
MFSIINFVFYFLLQILTGYVFLLSLNLQRQLNTIELLAISYGIGMGITSMFVFLFNFDFLFSFLTMVFLIITFLIINRKRITFDLRFLYRPFSKSEKVLSSIIIFIVLYVFFLAVIYPMESRDSLLIWGLKAKAIYLKGGFPFDLLKESDPDIFHLDYPLLIPIQEVLFYNFLGRFDDALVKVIFAVWYLSFLIIFYFLLRRFILRKFALIFVLFLASLLRLGRFFSNGYADSVMAFYFSLGFLFLYLGYIKEKNNFFYLSAILSSIGGWVKNEGIAWCLINFMLLWIVAFLYYFKNEKNKSWEVKKGIIFYVIMMLIFILPWQVFRIRYALKSDILREGFFSLSRFLKNIERLYYISCVYLKEFFNFKNWNLVWILFLFSFLLNIKNVFSKKYFLFTGLFLGFFGILSIIYILTYKDLHWHLTNSVDRLFIHIVPTVIFWMAIFFEDRLIDKIDIE